MTVAARATELAALTRFVASFWTEAKLPAAASYPFELALEEVFVNIVSYATDPARPGRVTVAFASAPDHVRMTISDDSAAFDPLSLASPDTSGELEERRVGGLGIHLIRTMMDEVTYRHEANQNHLTMIKHLEPGPIDA
jgi:anti-sigma regulatory factor (Ser/Thr protein kinase)